MLIIAEIAQAHEGSLGIAHSYIDALAETGVHAVKFQTHLAHAESSIHEPFRVKFSYEDATRYDYWKRMEFTSEQWAGLKQHCEDKGLEFISSPFSNAAVDLLERLGVKRYKIGSGEVTNYLMLEKIARTGKPILLSSGMSSLKELDEAVAFLRPFGNHLTVLQCTTAYPTQPEQWGLNVIPLMRERYKLPVGFSDHSGDIFACLAAAAMGANVLEFHAVFDKRLFGPDAPASLTIDQIKQLAWGVGQIERSLTTPVDKERNEEFQPLKKIFEKSLAVNQDLPAGHVIHQDDLESKKPAGHGIPATRFREVVGKILAKDIKAWQFLTEEYLT
ncbi:MAG: N-acetylneuraminate synthase family protein [Haliscomenobacter sp.]|nr:N-acetylneuraminate synthase family protein [Haliscomenobacter sp.]